MQKPNAISEGPAFSLGSPRSWSSRARDYSLDGRRSRTGLLLSAFLGPVFGEGARGQLDRLDEDIGLADDAIKAMAKADESARRLMSIPGIGPVTASAIAASVQDVSSFSGSREFSAYLGMTPRQNSSAARNDWAGS